MPSVQVAPFAHGDDEQKLPSTDVDDVGDDVVAIGIGELLYWIRNPLVVMEESDINSIYM